MPAEKKVSNVRVLLEECVGHCLVMQLTLLCHIFVKSERRIRPRLGPGPDSAPDSDSIGEESSYSGSSGDDDDLQPAPAADVVVAPPIVRAVGRPKREDPIMDAEAFVGSKMTMGKLVGSLVEIGARYNLSEQAQVAVFGTLRKALPMRQGTIQFPSYKHAVSMVRSRLDEPKQYPVCPRDDYVHRVTVGDLAPNVLKALKCPHCGSRLGDDKGRPIKVKAAKM